MAEYKNPVFGLLLEDENDIEALTAYGLYKRHKRQWAKKFLEDTGEPPTTDDDAAFSRTAATPDQLSRYRKDAQDILVAFANQTVIDATPDIEKDAITTRIEKAASRVQEQSSFKQQIISGIFSTLITTAVLILLTIGLKLFGLDVVDGINSLGSGHSSENVSQSYENLPPASDPN